jgi:hypothetical protein
MERFEEFLTERKYLKNVSDKTLMYYKCAFARGRCIPRRLKKLDRDSTEGGPFTGLDSTHTFVPWTLIGPGWHLPESPRHPDSAADPAAGIFPTERHQSASHPYRRVADSGRGYRNSRREQFRLTKSHALCLILGAAFDSVMRFHTTAESNEIRRASLLTSGFQS